MSIGTVDRVLHNRGRVSKPVADKVRRIIEELDYRPNIFAKHLRLGRSHVFGVLMPKPSQDSGYWGLPIKGIDRARAELASQRVETRFYFYDKASDVSVERAGKDALAARLDGLLIAPIHTPGFDKVLARIPPGFAFVFFDSIIPDVPYVSSIGQDSFQSGVLACRLMNLLVRDPGGIAVLRVLPEDYHIDDRVKGFLHFCLACPGLRVKVYEINGVGRREVRDRAFRRAFREMEELKGVFVTNASTHLAAEYARSHAAGERVRVIGYDLVRDNVRWLKEGAIDFLISQQSERQGYEGIMALFRHVVLREHVEKKIMMQLDIVTAETVDYYQS